MLGLLADAATAAGDLRTVESRRSSGCSALDPSAAEWRRIGEMRLASEDCEGAEKALRRALARDARDPARTPGSEIDLTVASRRRRSGRSGSRATRGRPTSSRSSGG